MLASNTDINYPWANDRMSVSKDWFPGVVKRNVDTATRKPQSLSRAAARALGKAVAGYFALYKHLCTKLDVHPKPRVILSIDETGFLVNAFLRKQQFKRNFETWKICTKK